VDDADADGEPAEGEDAEPDAILEGPSPEDEENGVTVVESACDGPLAALLPLWVRFGPDTRVGVTDAFVD
jgi:hypothetical protein